MSALTSPVQKYNVSVFSSGRGGYIHYSDAYTEFNLSFEYTYDPSVCYMIIMIPGKRAWVAATGIPSTMMDTTLQRIGNDIISKYAPSYKIAVYDAFMEIVS